MIQYTYDHQSNSINTYPSGVLIVPDILEYFEILSTDASILPNAKELVNFIGLDDIEISFLSTLSLKAGFLRMKDKVKIDQTIFIVDNDFSYGMARMMQFMLSDLEHVVFIKKQE